MCKIFENNGLKVTIEANAKEVNFLDVTLNLSNSIYKPYMKENNVPLYVHKKSNHPPTVIANIPLGINRRLNSISATKEVFESAAPEYQQALDRSGYDHKLVFEPPSASLTKKKNRRRNTTWFNPPFSLNVKSNVGKDFLKLIETAFPPSNPLHKLFTRQTLKLSYKCMPSMAQAISRHNAQLLKGDQQLPSHPACNCRAGVAKCPVQGDCQRSGVVYKATVTDTSTGANNTYIGMTGRRFKDRWQEHKHDAKSVSGKEKTKLSAHIWEMKDRGAIHETSWELIDKAATYNPTTRKCLVCLKEKYHIMYSEDPHLLNQRQEVFSSCRHMAPKRLSNVE